MGSKEFNEIFASRLKYYLDKYDMSQADLARKLNVGTTTVSNWYTALKTPRMDKVDAMCELFHCKRRDLMELPSEDEQFSKAIRIPVFGDVAAGNPIEAVENIRDYVDIPTDWVGDYRGFVVHGDSMSPRIQDGDILIVRRQDDANSGDIVVAMIDEGATVKRLVKHEDYVTLQPFNPSYDTMIFDGGLKIWGKVVELRARL